LAGYLEFLILQDGDGTERLAVYGPVISIAVPLGSRAPSRPSVPTTWRAAEHDPGEARRRTAVKARRFVGFAAVVAVTLPPAPR
jgi:hypothetical protein